MTSVKKVVDAFLSKILDDEYASWTLEEVMYDANELLNAAIASFKFPRHSLERDESFFKDDLDNQEIQILATYMKV